MRTATFCLFILLPLHLISQLTLFWENTFDQSQINQSINTFDKGSISIGMKNNQCWVMKNSMNGVIEWEQYFDIGYEAGEGKYICEESDGVFIISANVKGKMHNDDNNSNLIGTGAFIAKINQDGALFYDYKYSNTFTFGEFVLEVTSDSLYFGMFRYNRFGVNFDKYEHGSNNYSNHSFHVQAFGPSHFPGGWSFLKNEENQTIINHFYISGGTLMNSIEFYGNPPFLDVFPNVKLKDVIISNDNTNVLLGKTLANDLILIKASSNFEEIWESQISFNTSEEPVGLIELDAGYIIVSNINNLIIIRHVDFFGNIVSTENIEDENYAYQCVSIFQEDSNVFYISGNKILDSQTSSWIRKYEMSFSLGEDLVLCPMDTARIGWPEENLSYLWSTGDTTNFIEVYEEGVYTLTSTSSLGVETSDTVNVEIEKIMLQLEDEYQICTSQILNLNLSDSNKILWSTGDTTSEIRIEAPQNYWVEIVSENECEYKNEFEVINEFEIDLNSVVVQPICFEEKGNIYINLDSSENYKFLWSSGSESMDLLNASSGIYKLSITNISNECEYVYAWQITETQTKLIADVQFPVKNLCSLTESLILEPDVIGGTPPYSFEWNTGDETKYLEISSIGLYSVTITDSIGCIDVAEFIIEDSESNIDGVLWSYTYPGLNDEKVQDIRPTEDGGFICGIQAQNDFIILKLDQCGSVLWEQKFINSIENELVGVLEMDDGSFLVGVNTEISVGKLIKLNNNGEIVSERMISNFSENGIQSEISSIEPYVDNSALIFGKEIRDSSSVVFFYIVQTDLVLWRQSVDQSIISQPYLGIKSSIGSKRIPVILRQEETNLLGDLYIDDFIIGNNDKISDVFDLIQTEDGDYLVSYQEKNPGINKIVLYNSSGTKLAEYGSKGLVKNEMIQIKNGQYAIAEESENFRISIFDAELSEDFISFEFGGSSLDRSTCIAKGDNYSLVLGGLTSSTDGDVAVNYGGTDAWILALSPDELNVDNISALDYNESDSLNLIENWNFKIYPNPNLGMMTVEALLPNRKQIDLIITNSLGQIIRAIKYKSKNKLMEEIELPTGLYFVHINIEGQKAIQKIVVN